MSRVLRPLLLLCLFAFALPGQAAVWCVGTAQQCTMPVQRPVVADSPVIIKLRTGTYIDGAGIGHFNFTQAHSNQLVEISAAGAAPTATAGTRVFDPALTVIAGASNAAALYLNTGTGQSGNLVYAST